ncbi:MAG TPA: class I SAM-dependent methyltransferase [Steroidobacteraceae bacterium]|nr:class I SAM-dependent methyltransferase [Steroidobacteraceae bacterium]
MKLAHLAKQAWLSMRMRSSADYWEQRYSLGMDSGAGSYGELASYKAGFLNAFVASEGVRSVLELGCGDGNQLTLARYPSYLGLDVSRTAIDRNAERFRGQADKSFLWYDPARSINLGAWLQADLVLSLDVIYHLVEDRTYRDYLQSLFGSARRFVIIYSSDSDTANATRHVRHRKFTADVAREFPQFRLREHVPNPHRALTFADFYVYARATPAG